MKSGKFSPMLVALLLGLAASLSGLAYVILTDETAMVNNTGLLFAVGGIVIVAIIGLVMIRDTRKQLTEQAEQRLNTILAATELGAGFQIALRDLEIRGIGYQYCHGGHG